MSFFHFCNVIHIYCHPCTAKDKTLIFRQFRYSLGKVGADWNRSYALSAHKVVYHRSLRKFRIHNTIQRKLNTNTDEYANTFVISDGGKLEATGDTDWYDGATGEYYAALVVNSQDDESKGDSNIVIPNGYLPEGYSIKKAGNYFVIDNDDEKTPEDTSFDGGIIYAATTLSLGVDSGLSPEVYTVIWQDEDGTELEKMKMYLREQRLPMTVKNPKRKQMLSLLTLLQAGHRMWKKFHLIQYTPQHIHQFPLHPEHIIR